MTEHRLRYEDIEEKIAIMMSKLRSVRQRYIERIIYKLERPRFFLYGEYLFSHTQGK